jgi:hypothetical protein
MRSVNSDTWSLMKDGYVILRNFIPKSITTLSLDAWKTIEGNAEVNDAVFHQEHDICFDSPEETLGKSIGGYCTPHGVALHRWLTDELKSVIDIDLGETYSYSRKYSRGAYLKAHTDRPSCEISATVCLDYSCDNGQPWSIWIQNDGNYLDQDCNTAEIHSLSQGLPLSERTGIRIDLNVGDVLLYQGPNVIHWRDTLQGEYSYHVFLHYINKDSTMSRIPEWHSNNPNPVLTYDGRKDPYTVEHDKDPQRYNLEKFINTLDSIENKIPYVNNYNSYKRETLIEKLIRVIKSY